MSSIPPGSSRRPPLPPDAEDGGLDDAAWVEKVRQAVATPQLGRLGPYELLARSGHGGQGVVYRARDSRSGRVVALKRMNAGVFATDSQRLRFERELEALLGLRHPNIVGVIRSEPLEGLPVLVMEWVEGVPVDRWASGADDAGGPRPLREFLHTFVAICDAVHHAHQRGVIHRDLKPNNVLVDARGQPHVLDFGLAKLCDGGALAGGLTHSSAFVGTPAYAAPEQVRGENDAVDVRTDVYALGAILYQCLTGRPPFALDEALADLFDAIQNRVPQPPSRLGVRVAGELDAIAMKALAKEAARRYASVDALAADVRRYLAGEPIEARRGMRLYALRKTLWRYRLPVGMAVAAIVLLGASAVKLALMYSRQAQVLAQVQAAHDAETAARQTSQRVQTVLEQLLLALGDIGRGADPGVRRLLLSQAVVAAERRLRDDPAALAAAHVAIGRTYQQLAMYDEAEHYLRAALRMREELYGREHVDVAESFQRLGELLADRSHVRAAEPLFSEALALRRALLPAGDVRIADSVESLAYVLQARGAFAEAEALYRQTLELRRAALGPAHVDLARPMTGIGYTLLSRGEPASAADWFRAALELLEAAPDPEPLNVAGRRIDLAKALMGQGDLAAAEPLLRSALHAYRERLGDEHDNVAWAAHRLGVLLHRKGDDAEAEPLLREALATYGRVLGPCDMYVAFVGESLAELLVGAGRMDEAREVLALAEAALETLPAGNAEIERVRSSVRQLQSDAASRP
ncbi:MAG: serine/threonine protein kinase [Phycisphaerae bacterium]